MSARVKWAKVPTGWRVLRHGDKIRKSDRWTLLPDPKWRKIGILTKGICVGWDAACGEPITYIRRAQPRRHAGKGKK